MILNNVRVYPCKIFQNIKKAFSYIYFPLVIIGIKLLTSLLKNNYVYCNGETADLARIEIGKTKHRDSKKISSGKEFQNLKMNLNFNQARCNKKIKH